MRFHVVRRGDTLWKISQRFGLALGDLRRWNGLAVGDVLRVGTRLRLTPLAGGGR